MGCISEKKKQEIAEEELNGRQKIRQWILLHAHLCIQMVTPKLQRLKSGENFEDQMGPSSQSSFHNESSLIAPEQVLFEMPGLFSEPWSSALNCFAMARLP